MNQLRLTIIIIHGFALLHASTALLLRLFLVPDEIFLTMLTIAMVVYVSRIWKAPLYVGLSLAMIGSFMGYYIGTSGADLLYAGLGIFRNSLMTLMITETIGWVVYLVVRKR